MRHEPTKDKISVISEQELVEKQKAPEKPRICANGKNCIFYPFLVILTFILLIL